MQKKGDWSVEDKSPLFSWAPPACQCGMAGGGRKTLHSLSSVSTPPTSKGWYIIPGETLFVKLKKFLNIVTLSNIGYLNKQLFWGNKGQCLPVPNLQDHFILRKELSKNVDFQKIPSKEQTPGGCCTEVRVSSNGIGQVQDISTGHYSIWLNSQHCSELLK